MAVFLVGSRVAVLTTRGNGDGLEITGARDQDGRNSPMSTIPTTLPAGMPAGSVVGIVDMGLFLPSWSRAPVISRPSPFPRVVNTATRDPTRNTAIGATQSNQVGSLDGVLRRPGA